MKQLEASIEIKAPPEQVWAALIDFKRYPEWNPFIISLDGKAEAGETLKELIQQPDGKQVKLTLRILTVEAPKRLVWKGYFGAPFLFSGQHTFILEKIPTGTRLIQQEVFTGLALPMMNVEEVLPGYHQMNQALKTLVENAN